MSFLAPGFLWLLAAIPLVIALHFLRNRRRHQVVSALFLWQQASEQANVRRRFSLWWLLLLQILAVIVSALALAQPVLVGRGAADRIIIIDASASMAATDPDGMRLVKAVRGAAGLAADGGRVALIRAGTDATVVFPLAASEVGFSNALAGLVAADASADLDRALELADSLAAEAEVHLFTDASPPAHSGYTWHGVAGAGHNLGITSFELGPQQAFIAVTSSWPQPRTVTVSLERDGQPAGLTELLVPAGGQGNVTFPTEGQVGLFRASVVAPEGDALQLDDEAWAGSRQLSVYVADNSEPIERALAAVPGTVRAASAGAADVIVARSGRQLPDSAASLLLFAPRSSAPEYLEVRDWSQSDPLLRFVDMIDAQVGLDPAWQPESEPQQRVLARSSDLRPVLLAYSAGGRQVVEFGFDPAQSDLIFRPAFPALIANVLDAFRGEAALRLGQLLPEGASLDGSPASHALLPGVYDYPGGQVTVSLLSVSETRLPGPGPTALPPGEPGAVQEEAAAGDSNLTAWLLLALPLLLLLEWLLWSRRSARPVRA